MFRPRNTFLALRVITFPANLDEFTEDFHSDFRHHGAYMKKSRDGRKTLEKMHSIKRDISMTETTALTLGEKEATLTL